MKRKFKFRLLTKLAIVIIAVSIIRIFLIDTFRVTTGSMEPTLKVGDIVLVDKVSIGSRIPTSFGVPFVEADNNILRLFGINTYTGTLWDTRRLPGFSNINRNDIIAFNMPIASDIPVDFRTLYIKRCVGIPGDVIEVKEGEMFINNLPLAKAALEKDEWFVTTCSSIDSWTEIVNSKDLIEVVNLTSRKPDEHLYKITTSDSNMLAIRRDKRVISINHISEKETHTVNLDIYPHLLSSGNNVTKIKPIQLPKRGETIVIDSSNADHLLTLIKMHEDVHTFSDYDKAIKSKAVLKHTFKHDYYYFVGDNRWQSFDSRYWGPVPDDYIVGKVRSSIWSH